MQASPLRKLAALAEARKKQGVKVYHLNIGQPDLPTAPAVFEAIKNFNQPTIAYAPSNGIPMALSAWRNYFKHNGLQFEENEMIVTAGGSEAITFAMCTVCDANDEIIVFEPFYTNYNGFATLANVKLRAVPLSISDGFHLPPEEKIEAYITSRTRAILICSPSNPTGAAYTEDELRNIAEVVEQSNLIVISDDVYEKFLYDSPRCPHLCES